MKRIEDKKHEEDREYQRKYHLAHPNKRRENYQKYYLKHPEKMKEYNEKHRKEDLFFRLKALEILGNKCVVCGYTGVALQVDHINGHGHEEFLKIYSRGIYLKIINGSKDYQLLCATHNIEKKYKNNEHRYAKI